MGVKGFKDGGKYQDIMFSYSLSLRSWPYCVAVLCTGRVRFDGGAAVPATPFFGSLLRRQNFNHTIPPATQANILWIFYVRYK